MSLLDEASTSPSAFRLPASLEERLRERKQGIRSQATRSAEDIDDKIELARLKRMELHEQIISRARKLSNPGEQFSEVLDRRVTYRRWKLLTKLAAASLNKKRQSDNLHRKLESYHRKVTVDAAKAATKQEFADNLEVKLQKAKARRSALLYQRQSVAIKHNIRVKKVSENDGLDHVKQLDKRIQDKLTSAINKKQAIIAAELSRLREKHIRVLENKYKSTERSLKALNRLESKLKTAEDVRQQLHEQTVAKLYQRHRQLDHSKQRTIECREESLARSVEKLEAAEARRAKSNKKKLDEKLLEAKSRRDLLNSEFQACSFSVLEWKLSKANDIRCEAIEKKINSLSSYHAALEGSRQRIFEALQTRKEATKSKQALAEDLRQKKILSIVSKLRQRHDELKKKATANSSPPRQEVNTGDKLVSAQCRREEQLEEKLQKLREHHSEIEKALQQRSSASPEKETPFSTCLEIENKLAAASARREQRLNEEKKKLEALHSSINISKSRKQNTEAEWIQSKSVSLTDRQESAKKRRLEVLGQKQGQSSLKRNRLSEEEKNLLKLKKIVSKVAAAATRRELHLNRKTKLNKKTGSTNNDHFNKDAFKLWQLVGRLTAADATRRAAIRDRVERARTFGKRKCRPHKATVCAIHRRLNRASYRRSQRIQAKVDLLKQRHTEIKIKSAGVEEKLRRLEALKAKVARAEERRAERVEKMAKRLSEHNSKVAAMSDLKDTSQEHLQAAIDTRLKAANGRRLDRLKDIQASSSKHHEYVDMTKKVVMDKRAELADKKERQIQDKLDSAEYRRREVMSLKKAGIYNNNLLTTLYRIRRNIAAAKIQRKWKSFRAQYGSTNDLVREYSKIKPTMCSEDVADAESQFNSFEKLAATLQSKKTLRVATQLFSRLALKIKLAKDENMEECLENLRRIGQRGQSYMPARLAMSTYMINIMPEAVLGPNETSSGSELRDSLIQASFKFSDALETVCESAESGIKKQELSSLHKSWLNFLECFVAWKCVDEEMLLKDITSKALEMQESVFRLVNGRDVEDLHPDLRISLENLEVDLAILRQSVVKIAGERGATKFDKAVGDQRLQILSETAEQEKAAEEDSVEELSNIAIVHELLYNPDFDITSVGDAQHGTSALKSHVRSIAEVAFWDVLEEELSKGSESGIERFLQVCEDIREKLLAYCPQKAQPKLEEILDFSASTSTIKQDGLHVEASLDLFKRTLHALEVLGAPARDEELKEAADAVLSRFSQEKNSENKVEAIVGCVVDALKIVYKQMEVLRTDLANAQFQMILPYVVNGGGVEYERSSFSSKFNVTFEEQDVSDKLPRTAEWIQESLQDMQGLEEEVNVHMTTRAVPRRISSGLGSLINPMSQTELQDEEERVLKGVWDDLLGWKNVDAALRNALMNVALSMKPLTAQDVAEVLYLDERRILALQNGFQKCFILAICCLAARQLLHPVTQVPLALGKGLVNAAALLDDKSFNNIRSLAECFADSTFPANDESDDAVSAKKTEFIENMDRFVTKSIINEDDPVSINVRKRLKTVFQISVLLGDDYEKRAKDHLRKCGAEEIFRWAKDVCVNVVHMSSVLKNVYGPILKNMVQASS